MLSFFFNILISVFFIYITLIFNRYFFKINNKLFILALLYHFCLTFFYIYFLKVGDWETYLNLEGLHEYKGVIKSLISSNIVYSIISILNKINITNFNIILFFSLISFYGIVIFVINLMKIGLEKKFSYLLLFIPGIHFWTSVPGKDGLILFFLSCFFYMYINKKIFFSILFILIVALIRPHIGLIFLLSVLITEFLTIKPREIKFLILLFSLISVYFFINNEYVGGYFIIDNNVSQNFLIKLLNTLHNIAQKYTLSGSHYESSNLFINIFNYILFPFEFIAKKNSLIINLSIMIEIFTLILLSVSILNNKKKIIIDKKIVYFLFICVFIYLMIMPQVFFNFGLNTRQKWMIVPFLIYFVFLLKNLLNGVKKI